ncbi:hypothetical protein TSOC_000628 [Tetrabaena socialis]|uniref:Uncharacterized protein n=1 Tax=Tetrabaena socialis TaxID=47790 RepID=A0A2J8AIS0_9CHLO|nr:hypothetical protein TSOC_000628 [Tetrabaena socialis]|eukprot:PNH12411.1 hypothetical protein TSOC_000628 [Tetrabaena socialis]
MPPVRAAAAQHCAAAWDRAHVWLAEAPPGVQPGAWDVVALAALAAMEHARRHLRAAIRPAAAEGAEADATGAAARPQPEVGSGEEVPQVEMAKARAVLEFWQRLRGFAALGVPRRGWDEVGSDHPILSVADGRMRCAHPAGLDMDGEP